MENKSDPRIKAIQKNDLKGNDGDGPLFSGPHLSAAPKKSHNYIEHQSSDNLIHLALPNLLCNIKGIENLRFKKNNNNLQIKNMERSQKSLQLFWKNLNRLPNSISKEKAGLYKKALRKNTIDLLHSELYSWHTLLRHLVSMPSLSNFDICQILCHEKGTTNVVSYSFGGDSNLQENKTSIESFNKVFNQIKKSKGKQFSQTQLSIPEFNFVGSFLASIFQLKTHNVLFLLSENSFFPIPSEVIDEVDEILPQVKSVLEKVVLKDMSDSKISNLFRVFEILPNPICILNPLGNSVFQNDEYKKISVLENSDSNNVIETSLSGGYKLLMLQSSGLSKSDVQHYQRVGLLGELLNTLQHELSNPLFGIQLATDFLALTPNNESVSEFLREISENCKRCQDIIRDFKFIYQGGDQFFNIKLKKLIKETLTLTKSVSRGIQKEIQLESEDLELNTNPTWLSQIIFNLIINSSQAIQSQSEEHIRKGKIYIIVKAEAHSMLSITIEDNGPGIDEKMDASVFDPFYTTKEKGTGLGLAICQSLCEKLGGALNYKNNAMGGASFSLLLPNNEIHKE